MVLQKGCRWYLKENLALNILRSTSNTRTHLWAQGWVQGVGAVGGRSGWVQGVGAGVGAGGGHRGWVQGWVRGWAQGVGTVGGAGGG